MVVLLVDALRLRLWLPTLSQPAPSGDMQLVELGAGGGGGGGWRGQLV